MAKVPFAAREHLHKETHKDLVSQENDKAIDVPLSTQGRSVSAGGVRGGGGGARHYHKEHDAIISSCVEYDMSDANEYDVAHQMNADANLTVAVEELPENVLTLSLSTGTRTHDARARMAQPSLEQSGSIDDTQKVLHLGADAELCATFRKEGLDAAVLRECSLSSELCLTLHIASHAAYHHSRQSMSSINLRTASSPAKKSKTVLARKILWRTLSSQNLNATLSFWMRRPGEVKMRLCYQRQRKRLVHMSGWTTVLLACCQRK